MSAWLRFTRVISATNIALGYISAGLIVISALILTYEVLMRYYFVRPSSWVIEASVFLLVAATFLAAGLTQLRRGHVNIEILDGVLPDRVNRWRYFAVDLVALLFSLTIAALSWRQFHYTWAAGWHFPTMWAPPMWIPYSLISVGMTLLALQQLIQLVDERIPALFGSPKT